MPSILRRVALSALDARTGKTLWSTDNQAATLAGPISYEIGGEQYIAVLAGYGGAFFLIEGFLAASEGHALNGRVYVFKLGGTAPRPTLNLQKAPVAKPPVIAVSTDAYNRGGDGADQTRAAHAIRRQRSAAFRQGESGIEGPGGGSILHRDAG